MMEDSKRRKGEITIWEAVGYTWDILLTVLIVTGAFAFGGVWLDKRFGTVVLFTVISFALLIPVGYVLMKKKAKNLTKRMGEEKPKTNT
jgi:uncharacterized membrane protein YfcA